jgi:predicted permease
VSAIAGRTFRQDDAVSGLVPLSGGQAGPDRPSGVLLTYRGWQQLFGGERVVGRNVILNGIPRSIVGVLPADFVGPMGATDFYFAIDLQPVAADPISGRGSQWLALIGRLKSGRTQDEAQSEIIAIARQLTREYPRDNSNVAVMPLRDALVGESRTPLLVVMASALLVLLIACANLAGAVLSRSISRRTEFAVRTALGAGRHRLIRQVLTEAALLGVIGGAVGLGLATFLLAVLRDVRLAALPVYADIALDSGAVLVTAALALGTGIAFGVAPAMWAARSDPERVLREATRGTTESRGSGRLRGALVAGQIALCTSLLMGAGLLGRSLWTMTTAPLGFTPERVLAATVQLPPRNYPTPDARLQFYEQFADRLRAVPGVDMVAATSAVPTAVRQRTGITLEGLVRRENEAQPLALGAVVSDDYFRLLHIPLRQGRTFDQRDRPDAPPTLIISESMARRFWPSGDALGVRIRIGPNPNAPLMEVIGIVGDVRNDRSRVDAEPIVYRPARQVPAGPGRTFLIHTRSESTAVIPIVERELAALDRTLPLQRALPLEEIAAEGLASRRVPVFLDGRIRRTRACARGRGRVRHVGDPGGGPRAGVRCPYRARIASKPNRHACDATRHPMDGVRLWSWRGWRHPDRPVRREPSVSGLAVRSVDARVLDCRGDRLRDTSAVRSELSRRTTRPGSRAAVGIVTR